MLSYAKSATVRPGDRLNGLKNGKTQLFNSRGDVKWACFQKKVECSFNQTWMLCWYQIPQNSAWVRCFSGERVVTAAKITIIKNNDRLAFVFPGLHYGPHTVFVFQMKVLPSAFVQVRALVPWVCGSVQMLGNFHSMRAAWAAEEEL